MNWATVLTSAAVGVLVSGAVTLFGQFLERRARQRELLLSKALEMAIRKSDVSLKAAELSGHNLSLIDDVINAGTYYRWLKGLLIKGQLPEDAKSYRQGEKP